MAEAFIIDALRTPIGRYAGALAPVRPDDLAALVLRAVLERSGVPAADVEDVILGCANPACPRPRRGRPSTASVPPGSRPSTRPGARSAAATPI
jgi:acetyl-CoA acetyltransferase